MSWSLPSAAPGAQMLQAGAGLDVIGLRHWELAPETVASAMARYPPHDMKKIVFPFFVAESHPERGRNW